LDLVNVAQTTVSPGQCALAAASVLNRLLGALVLGLGALVLGLGALVLGALVLGAGVGGLVAAACASAGPVAAKNRNREITSFPIADLQEGFEASMSKAGPSEPSIDPSREN
jgi:hypothetical protein